MSESTEFTGEVSLSVISQQDTISESAKKQKTYKRTIHSIEEYNANKREILNFFTASVKRELESKSGSTKTLCTKFFNGQVPKHETMGYLFEYIVENFNGEVFYEVKEKNEKGETVTKKVSKKELQIKKLRTRIW